MGLSKHYIVNLEFEVWIAPWDGDPGRTTRRDLAKRFDSMKRAEHALAAAREYREFPRAYVETIRATVI